MIKNSQKQAEQRQSKHVQSALQALLITAVALKLL